VKKLLNRRSYYVEGRYFFRLSGELDEDTFWSNCPIAEGYIQLLNNTHIIWCKHTYKKSTLSGLRKLLKDTKNLKLLRWAH
jgi:hypothetical protein